jgi:hypothetical protein
LGWFWRLGDNPELAVGMMNDGDALAGGGTDGPTATAAYLASLGLRLIAGVFGGEADGAADGAVLTEYLPRRTDEFAEASGV